MLPRHKTERKNHGAVYCHLWSFAMVSSAGRYALPISFTPTYTAEDSLMNSQRELDESGFKNEQDVIQQAHDEECLSCSRHVNISGILTDTCKIKDYLFTIRFPRSAVRFIVMAVV